MVEEARERRGPPGPAHEPHMQSYAHHPGMVGAFGVQHVEAVSGVGDPVVARAGARDRAPRRRGRRVLGLSRPVCQPSGCWSVRRVGLAVARRMCSRSTFLLTNWQSIQASRGSPLVSGLDDGQRPASAGGLSPADPNVCGVSIFGHCPRCHAGLCRGHVPQRCGLPAARRRARRAVPRDRRTPRGVPRFGQASR